MITARHITKLYRGMVAVDDCSFDVPRGGVVGLVGPNGAGKTTTLRILAGYVAPSGGVVHVAGHDVITESESARRCMGYLPESAPLYPDMRVDEYLRFRARIKGVVSRHVAEAVTGVRKRCGLEGMGHELIGCLSAGYRKRVGLADALVHDPAVLILDEPTSELDPDQHGQLCDLISSLRGRHTVMLASHRLEAIERMCDRVIVIRGGRIIAADTPAGLRRLLDGKQRVVAHLQGPRMEIENTLRGLPGVRRLVLTPDGPWWICRMDSDAEEDIRPACFDAVRRAGWILRELQEEKRSLEEVYLELTRPDSGVTEMYR